MSRWYPLMFLFLFIIFGCSDKINSPGNNISAGSNENTIDEWINREVPEKLNPGDYITWMDDKKNGLKVEKMIGEYTYMLQYKSTDYVAVMDLKRDSIGNPEFQKKREEYSSFEYYNFRISSETPGELLMKNVEGAGDYEQRIRYFSFDMQKDIKLLNGKDTADCVLFHFERVFGVAPYATFLLGFPVSNSDGDKTILYDDKVFGAGRVYLTIRSKNIKKLPSVIVS
jgi:hypothetical protein